MSTWNVVGYDGERDVRLWGLVVSAWYLVGTVVSHKRLNTNPTVVSYPASSGDGILFCSTIGIEICTEDYVCPSYDTCIDDHVSIDVKCCLPFGYVHVYEGTRKSQSPIDICALGTLGTSSS